MRNGLIIDQANGGHDDINRDLEVRAIGADGQRDISSKAMMGSKVKIIGENTLDFDWNTLKEGWLKNGVPSRLYSHSNKQPRSTSGSCINYFAFLIYDDI